MKGFSILEVLISIAILSIITGAIFLVLTAGDKVYFMDSGLLDLQQEARSAMARMTRELRCSREETISGGGSSISFDTPTLTDVRFYINNADNQLIREFPLGTQVVIGNYITALNFCCWHDDTGTCDTDCTDSKLIEISLTVTNTVRGRTLTLPIKEQVALRNE